jgi:hypothetical protein
MPVLMGAWVYGMTTAIPPGTSFLINCSGNEVAFIIMKDNKIKLTQDLLYLLRSLNFCQIVPHILNDSSEPKNP